jgi:hypothetical protein
MFVRGGSVVCSHHYWPNEAFEEQDVDAEVLSMLQQLPDMTELDQIAAYVSRHFQGAWSVDFLEDQDGKWWLNNMATASGSYHWPGSEHDEDFDEAKS